MERNQPKTVSKASLCWRQQGRRTVSGIVRRWSRGNTKGTGQQPAPLSLVRCDDNLHFAAPFERPAQGDGIGVFQVAPHG